MKLDAQPLLRLLPVIGPVIGLPEFKAVFDQLVGLLSEDDQDEAKSRYAARIAKSDAIHERNQS